MTELEWFEFVTKGRPSVVSVARLDSDMCAAIGASSTLVKLRHDYALKILQKHDVQPHHFRSLTWAIESGIAVQDRQGFLTFFRLDKFAGWFHATVKRNEHGTELWVATFHKTETRHVERKLNRCPVLRS